MILDIAIGIILAVISIAILPLIIIFFIRLILSSFNLLKKIANNQKALDVIIPMIFLLVIVFWIFCLHGHSLLDVIR